MKILKRFKALRKTQIQYEPVPKNKLAKFSKLPGHNPSNKDKLYRTLLMMKQAIKYHYGFRTEKAFHNLFKRCLAIDKINIVNVFQDRLERMLSSIIFRIGRCTIRKARQVINHCLIRVNGETINLPMYEVKRGDVISIKKDRALFPNLSKNVLPSWVKREADEYDNLTFVVTEEPVNLTKNKGFLLNVDYSSLLRFYSR